MADEATSTTETDAAAETSGDSTEATATEATSTEATDAVAGEEALGDAGKKALDAMKAKWKEADAARKALEADFLAFKAKAEGKEAEFTAAQETQRIKDEALAAANERIKRSEVKAAAKGVLADPQDAYKFLDLDSIEVSEDGDVDTAAITAALNDLITQKPYLGAQSGQRFTADVDGGARKVTPPASLDEQIAELEKTGDLKAAGALKAQRLVDLRNAIQ